MYQGWGVGISDAVFMVGVVLEGLIFSIGMK
jgi:hypothetical protein